MSFDVFSGRVSGRDWSSNMGAAAADLPRSAKGYVPDTYWRPAEMEAKIAELMSQRGGLFGVGPKRTRAEAVADMVRYMKDNRIGPMDVSGWSDRDHVLGDRLASDMGSLLLPAKQQAVLMNKVDDVRYDVRRAGATVGKGIMIAGAGIALLAFAQVYRTAKGK